MILDIIAGLFMGTLTGMGIGGGGLLVLYLTAVREMGQIPAQGCNLMFFVIASASALFVHRRKRRLNYRLIGIAVLLALVESRLGVGLTDVLPEETVRHMYGWMLIIAGVIAGARVVRGVMRKRRKR